MLEIILPWPSRDLHPNSRCHWAVKAKATRIARAQAYALAVKAGSAGINLPDGRVHCFWDFYPPDRRKRDDDGLLSSVKAARDGLADALGIDDSRFVSHPYIREETRKGGGVRVRITGGPE